MDVNLPTVLASVGAALLVHLLITFFVALVSAPKNKSGKSVGQSRFYERLAAALLRRGGGTNAENNKPKKARTAAEIMRGTHHIDVTERGGNGEAVDYRLWMELLVYDLSHADGSPMLQSVEEILQHFHLVLSQQKIPHVLYTHVYQPTQVGLLFWSQDVSFFAREIHEMLQTGTKVQWKYTMFGKTYSNGHEADLNHALLHKPIKMAMKEEHKYAIWYPLRRSGKFYLEEPERQC